jgi:hypothetical protein
MTTIRASSPLVIVEDDSRNGSEVSVFRLSFASPVSELSFAWMVVSVSHHHFLGLHQVLVPVSNDRAGLGALRAALQLSELQLLRVVVGGCDQAHCQHCEQDRCALDPAILVISVQEQLQAERHDCPVTQTKSTHTIKSIVCAVL